MAAKLKIGDVVATQLDEAPAMLVLAVGSDIAIMGFQGDKKDAVLCGWWDGRMVFRQQYLHASMLEVIQQ